MRETKALRYDMTWAIDQINLLQREVKILKARKSTGLHFQGCHFGHDSSLEPRLTAVERGVAELDTILCEQSGHRGPLS